MNPTELLKSIQNPQQFVISQVRNGNPIIDNLINLAQQGKNQEVEQIARNIFNTKGIDYEKDILPILKNFK